LIIARLELVPLWQDKDVPKKKKPKRFRAVEAVKALARERIGAPKASRIVPDRKKGKGQKHKPTFGELLEEN
jgi:hypothetical protein